MKNLGLPTHVLHTLILGLFLTGTVLIQGCDTLTGVDKPEENAFDDGVATPTSDTFGKLRHPDQLQTAHRTVLGVSGKAELTTSDLFLAFNPYEADGVTPRMLNRFEIANRILEEYGIRRRVLSKYGITHRILDKYGITRRVLNQYGITKRLLDRYGITPRLLSKYDDLITQELLAELGVTEAQLAEVGLSMTDIDDFNTLSALLNEYNLSVEQFFQEVETAVPTIRIKVHIDGVHLGLTLSIDSDVLDYFLEEIGNDPDILFVEPDMTIDTSELGFVSGNWYDKQIVPWGITHTETPIPSFLEMFSVDYNKANPVHVYVLDSGAMPDYWLDDIHYVEKKDFTMLFENPDQLMWDDSLAPDVSGFDPGTLGNPYDESGHGTHIAGTIGANNDLIGVVGMAPGVRIHSLKVLTKEGQTDITTLLAAVDYVTRAKQANPDWPVVVNLSLGVDIGTTSYNVLDEAIAASIEAGVIYVAAAGNDGRNAATYSPAHVAGVITVGAHNEQNQFASFSNYGDVVDILAPGENIISLSHNIDEVNAFESILASGTSYAAPHVTGAVARYLGQNPNATAEQVTNALLSKAESGVESTPYGTTHKRLHVKDLLATKEKTSKSRWSWFDRE